MKLLGGDVGGGVIWGDGQAQAPSPGMSEPGMDGAAQGAVGGTVVL